MIVHTMTAPEMVTEARKDYEALRRKVEDPLRRMRRESIRNKQEIWQMIPWRSPKNKNNWLILLHQGKDVPRIYSMVWYHDGEGRINAVWTTHSGLAFHIDRHVIERYGARFNPTANPLERLQSFFLENYFYTVEPVEPEGEDTWKVNIGLNQGMGLGAWDRTTELVYMRTFINHGQLFQQQEDAMERMDLERIMYSLTPGQRRMIIAMFKRVTKVPEGPALDWLNSLAA